MSSIASSAVTIQTSPQSVPSTPSWLGEVAVMAHYLSHLGLLEKLVREVHFSRKRFGTYETIDFICVLIGYTLSGEATLKGFYERLQPFASPFMALFGRSELPSRAALSRFLSVIDQPAVEALRALFQKDLVARPLWNCVDFGGSEKRNLIESSQEGLWANYNQPTPGNSSNKR